MNATPDSEYERTRTLLVREAALRRALETVQAELLDLQHNGGAGWMRAMDDDFQRCHAELIAKLEARAAV